MNQNEIRQRLVHCLITYRQNNFHSQKLMARLCNLSLDYYISIEQGISLPSLATAISIHKVTGIDLNTLSLPEDEDDD